MTDQHQTASQLRQIADRLDECCHKPAIGNELDTTTLYRILEGDELKNALTYLRHYSFGNAVETKEQRERIKEKVTTVEAISQQILTTSPASPEESLKLLEGTYDLCHEVPEMADELRRIAKLLEEIQEQEAQKAIDKPAKGIIESTPQNMADGFRNYAKTIAETANKFSYRQNDPELARLYISYRLSIENLSKLAKRDLNKDLPEVPELPGGNDYFAGMINFADYCKHCAVLLRGDDDNIPPNTQIEGEWSKPMAKIKMMAALGIDSYKTFNAFAKRYGIKEVGNRQTFIIRLDGMDAKTHSKLEKK